MSESADALMRQAEALHRQGRRAEAIAIFQQLLLDRPASAEGWYELGYLLKAEGRYQEALDAYAEALAHGVARPEEVHLNRAVIFSDHLRRDDAAEHELGAALALAPGYVPALLNRGNLHEERGQREQALACYDRIRAGAATTEPRYQDLCLEAVARSARLRPPASADDPALTQLREASLVAAGHGHVVRANLLFALGEACDRVGEYEQAFDAYTKGNRCLLRQAGRCYDRGWMERLIDALIAAFPIASPARTAPTAGSAAPLFICGMFRSGSTLVEQVLAAHSEVTAGGELDYLMRLAASRFSPFPASMATPDSARDAALADEYCAHLMQLFPDGISGRYITDKRPDNFQLIGLIKRMFPDARIIHSVRHPLDNGLSVFLQHINLRVAGYASDLADIGHFYGQYLRLMAHWKALYGDSIHDFDYDAFVRDPQSQLDALFAFLKLDTDSRCLEFHRLGNTVKTASYWQVRQPLHGNASGRWRNYASHLAPLQAALREAGVVMVDH